jgi:hypothetical protein
MTFLGLCRYFETIGKEKREIPGKIVDLGCKFWKPKENSNETIGETIGVDGGAGAGDGRDSVE